MELLIAAAGALFGVCWGSFLNVVAYRFLHNKPFLTARSHCPHCGSTIAWYDNLPIISWLLLRRSCRSCKNQISWLYPIIEILTSIIMSALVYTFVQAYLNFNSLAISIFENFDLQDVSALAGPSSFFSSPLFFSLLIHIVFFSALIISVRTDLEEMVILQCFSLWLVPFGLISSFLGLTHVGLGESCAGAILGYGILWLIGKGFKHFAHREGLGVGDMELLSLIGSFLGPFGVWASLMIGSISGLLVGISYLTISGKGRYTRIPFGPFLAFGATISFFFIDLLISFFMR